MSMGLMLAALALVPQPQHLVEKSGTCPASVAITYETDASVPAEGYRLVVSSNAINVVSSDDAGRYYADVTLAQMKDGENYPCVEIEDAPKYPWRGMLLDDCRHFFGKETVLRMLDLMAQYKYNRFHWHLTDDQGWRLEIPGKPELVRYGSVRSKTPCHGKRPHFGKNNAPSDFDGKQYGPFYYTEADVKEILAYAAERHIQVVPEIELPGHFQSVLAAYPHLACQPENLSARDPLCAWGISKEVMCIGNDEAVKFLEDVLDYVCRLFPGDVIHLGGDECPQTRWKTCPKCQARIQAEGLGDEHGLQPWITRHFVNFLAARGKRALGWDEYLLGDIPKSAIGMSWRESASGAGHELVSGAAAAVKGHDVVMTPCSYCYLDFEQALKEDPFQYIEGCIPLARCYAFDPAAGVPEEARKHILGGQANNWSEYTWNRYDLFWKMWPRAGALAEALWTAPVVRDFPAFEARMAIRRQQLIREGVNCAPLR